MESYTKTLEETIKEQAEAEKYAPMGKKSKKKDNWEQIEAELQEFLTHRRINENPV